VSKIEQWCKSMISRAAMATNQKVACSSHAGRTIEINDLLLTTSEI